MRLGVEASLVSGRRVPGDVELEGGCISAVGLPTTGGRGLAIPGLIDLQVNGFAGVDFLTADVDDYVKVGGSLLETGVTAYLPTFITSREEHLVAALGVLSSAPETGPRVIGAHLEGPFLSPHRLGVHPIAERRDPDVGLLDRLLAAGPVAMMTLAPELPGAAQLIDRLTERGVVVSLGHTDANAAQAHEAFARGVHTVTHLFNAMRPLGHRDPGVVGAALARDDVVVQLIVDGVHVADDVVRVVAAAAGSRLSLVTDAMAGATLGDGTYLLGGLPARVEGGIARREDGSLAGSVLTMIDAVRNLHALGVPLEDAIAAATVTPARVLGQPELGRLRVGGPADVVVLDDSLDILRVVVRGQERVAG